MTSKPRSELTQEQREKLRAADRRYYRSSNRQAYRERYYISMKDTPVMVAFNEYQLMKSKERRLILLKHYSHSEEPLCACCGEKTLQFLGFDHINGGAAKDYKEHGRGASLYTWLYKDRPSGFQVLCHNCNLSKGFYGVCPHKANTNKTGD